MAKVIKITFDKNGEPIFDGENFNGNECINEMKPFEEAIGKIGKLTMKNNVATITNKIKEKQHEKTK